MTRSTKRLLIGCLLSVAIAPWYVWVPGLAIVVACFSTAPLFLSIADLLLGCEDDSNPSDSLPMTANIPAESAKALGLTAPGDEAYIEVTEVNSDGSVVVMAEMEDAEDSAAPPPAPAATAIPEELGKMLGS